MAALYKHHEEKRTRPLLDELCKALQSVTMAYSRVFIVVDALDECQASDDCRAKLVSELFGLQALSGINIFATSRMNDEITALFAGAVHLRIRATDDDVRTYLHRRMGLPHSRRLDDRIRDTIVSEIIKAADGM